MSHAQPRAVAAEIVRNEPLTKEIHEIVLRLPDDWGTPQPGQFVQVECYADRPFALRRPFSIARFRKEEGKCHLHLVYGPIGEGTRALTERRSGETVELLGPLGRGFRPLEGRRPILVGGGRGVAPLLSLSDVLRETQSEGLILFGVRSTDQLHELEDVAYPVEVATQDGSVGFKGHLLELLSSLLSSGRIDPRTDAIYSCGPNPMLHALSDWAEEHGFPAQVSLETLFGCGFGICAGCAVPVRSRPGEQGDEFGHYRFACVEGPVFDGDRVDWEGVKE